MSWNPSPLEIERRNRIRVALWAYTYEFESVSLVSDAEFDKACLEIDLSVATDRPELDEWFKDNFSPYTGQWIHNHPELKKLKDIYKRLK